MAIYRPPDESRHFDTRSKTHLRQDSGPSIADIAHLGEVFRSLSAVPPSRAAKLLDVHIRTIYRQIGRSLEGVPRGKQRWVSVRSLLEAAESQYRSSARFDLLSQLNSRQR